MLCSGQRCQVMHGSTSPVALTPSLTENLYICCAPMGAAQGQTSPRPRAVRDGVRHPVQQATGNAQGGASSVPEQTCDMISRGA